jgi:DNA-binding transcriptional LysR family regulator
VTLRQLQIFIVVANRLNLRVAAEELHIAQSSISHHLRLLQGEFGKELHRKVGSGIDLTPTGILFLKECKSIIARIDRLKVTLHSKFAESIPTTLTVGGSYTASTSCLPLLLARFRKTHEDIRLYLRTETGRILTRMALASDLDVVVTHNQPAYRQLAAEPFLVEPVVLCVGRKHPLAKKKRLSWDDLRNFGFVIRKPRRDMGISARFIEGLKKKGFTPKVVMQCDSVEAKRAAIKNQMGIGICFRPTIEDDLKKGELVELDLPGGGSHVKSYIIYHKTRAPSAATQDFIQLLRDHRDKMQNRTKSKTLN